MNAKNYLRFFLIVLLLGSVLATVIPGCSVPGALSQAIDKIPGLKTETGAAQDSDPTSDEQVEISSTPKGEIYLFDSTKISVTAASALDLAIKNCNVYQDAYGDLLVLGEIINNSNIAKTNIEITLSFYDKKRNIFDNHKIPAYAEYLQSGLVLPFDFIYENKADYIDISEIKIGVNYRNYNKEFEGFPVVIDENFFYDKDIIVIKGNIFNLGSSEIEDLKLLCTFYNKKNQVVFIRECFLKNDKLAGLKKQNFEVKVLLDDYIEEFSHYRIEVFYRDSLKA